MLAVTQVVNLTAINTVNFCFEDIGQEILEAFPGDWMALVLEQIFLIISCFVPGLNFRTWQSEALVCYLMCVCDLCMHACFSSIWLFVTLWTVAHQAPLSMGFSSQEYWTGLPCPPPRDLPNPGIETASPETPALQVDSLPLNHWGNLGYTQGLLKHRT